MNNKDDERLRKTTIAFLKDFAKQGYENAVECIDWLEKQSEKPQGKSALEAAKEEKVDNQNCVKPTDKVEPKFREGDWVVQGHNILKIKCVGDTHYCFETVGGYTDDIFISEVDSQYHLWTIQDAKDGDVLACKGNIKNSNGIKYEWICLFNNLDNAFFTLTKLSNFIEEYDIDVKINYPDNTVPATKEQKEILFMAMTNAGYTFDFDKKELKKIEQKHAWSEEDENWLIDAINVCELNGYNETARWLKNRLKSLKDRVQPEQEWSEEDERSIRDSIFYLKSAKKYFEKDDDILWNEKWFNLCIKFLESLYKKLQPQPQWKPSKEQMNALDSTLQYSQVSHNSFEYLNSLFNDLKKLREE